VTDAPSLTPHELILGVSRAISDGSYSDARAALVTALDDGFFGEPPNVEVFLALRLLGEASRRQADFEAAMAAYQAADAMAAVMQRPDLASAAVEGMAIVAQENQEPIEALALFERALGLAEMVGDENGVIALLSNKGNLLVAMARFEDAEPVLREALAREPALPKMRGSIEDNLSLAVGGLDRFDEAIEHATSAAAIFEQVGAGYDRFEALDHLERFQRAADEDEAAVATFVEAHDLITALEARTLNVDRYLAYPEVTRRIQEGIRIHLAGEGAEGTEGALEFSMRATLAEQLREQAELDLEAGDFAAAEKALNEAREHWERLRAAHMLPGIHHALGNVYYESGQTAKAREHCLEARNMAHELGDARREMMACSSLARLIISHVGDLGIANALHQIARAKALQSFIVRAGDPSVDDGVIETLEASVCIDHDAYDLAERAIRRALALYEDRPDDDPGRELFAYRHWSRLLRLYTILRRRDGPGDAEEAAQLERRLLDYLDGDPDPRSSFSLRGTLGAERFAADDWTEETLALLVGACDAYEEIRERARSIGELSAYSEVVNAPFAEAIEVAVHLGRHEQALHLLERSKSRSLLEALGGDRRGDAAAVAPATAAELAAALAERGSRPVLLEFFAGPSNVLAFVLDGSGALEVRKVGDPRSAEWTDLVELVWRRSLAGEGSARQALALPATRRLADCVREVADGRPVYLSPHGMLHSLPLHLVEDEAGVLAPLPRVYHLPSGSLLRIAARPEAGEGTLVGGDPGGDLAFAAVEARGVAERFGVRASIGDACSLEWLREALDPGHPRLRVIHLACHARFRPMRGERSGLGLRKEGENAVVTVTELAALDWGSELVMLSACSSGQQEFGAGDEPAGIPRALLGRGARALIVSLWEVPDLATYLLVKNFYAGLPEEDELDLQDIGRALVDAQMAIRDMSARGLIATALELRAADTRDGDGSGDLTRCALMALSRSHAAAGRIDQKQICEEALAAIREGREPAPDIGVLDWGIQAELAEDPAYEVAPLRDPDNWAAFVLIGRR
jgi:CHAT domain-containing protein/tetratricopeptide (TPR) repeat protein